MVSPGRADVWSSGDPNTATYIPRIFKALLVERKHRVPDHESVDADVHPPRL